MTTPDYMLETYNDRDRLTKQFALFQPTVDQWLARALTTIRADISTPSDPVEILDVGCGEGLYSVHIVENFPGCRVIGIDKDEEAILTAQVVFGAQHDNVNFVQHDAVQPYAETSAYNLAIAILALVHTQDAAAALRNIHAVLKPGGLIYIRDLIVNPAFTVPGSPAVGRLLELAEKALARAGSPEYTLHVPQYLEDAGFRVVDSQTQTYVLGGTTREGQDALINQFGVLRSARRGIVDIFGLITAKEFDALITQIGQEIEPDTTGEWTVRDTLAVRV